MNSYLSIGLSMAFYGGVFFLITNDRVRGWVDGSDLPEHREFQKRWPEMRKAFEEQGMTPDQIMVEFLVLAPARRPLWARVLRINLDKAREGGPDKARQELRDELEATDVRRKYWREGGGKPEPQIYGPVERAPVSLPWGCSRDLMRIYEIFEERGPAITKEDALLFSEWLDLERRRAAWNRFIPRTGALILGTGLMFFVIYGPVMGPARELPDMQPVMKLMKLCATLASVVMVPMIGMLLWELIHHLRYAQVARQQLDEALERGAQLFL